MSNIRALSALDGRYENLVIELQDVFSEYGFIKQRVFVEIQWIKFLLKTLPALNGSTINTSVLDDIVKGFDTKEATKVKDIEKTTNHDVKAVEYYLKERFEELGLGPIKEWIHFACTSEDINNASYALMIKSGRDIIIKNAGKLLSAAEDLAKEYKAVPMMARTHGQPATPTTVGKEFINFAWRIKKEIENLKGIHIQAKFNGATGNFNAHHFVFPKNDWIKMSKDFISEYIGVEPIVFTTQINPNNYISEIMHSLARLSSIIIGLDRDMWGYISIGYFNQKLKKGEVGSSTMPHKVNPIDFENSEGNLGLAISLGEHLAAKLLNSRFQRDLSDSTVLRNIGSVFGYVLIGLKNVLKGLNKLDLNKQRLKEDLDANIELLAEPIQTVMRVYNEEKPYEKLKELTRGEKISREALDNFVENLKNVPDDYKDRMKGLMPGSYVGLSESLVDEYFKEQ